MNVTSNRKETQLSPSALSLQVGAGLIGYCVGIKLPNHINAPKQKKGTRAAGRYDLVHCWGRFPEPMGTLLRETSVSPRALYFRLKGLNRTHYNTTHEYSLEIGARENFTSLEPIYENGRYYLGSPERSKNRYNGMADVVYLITLGAYSGIEAIEVLCLSAPNAREFAGFYARGGFAPLARELREKQTELLEWQRNSSEFMQWWEELHQQIAPPRPIAGLQNAQAPNDSTAGGCDKGNS